jgi:ribosomal protein S12 methylthiotransferase accessory factor YcaO
LPKSLLFNHSCMYAKRSGVAAYHIVWISLCLRSVPGVRVLASAVDDSSSRPQHIVTP